VNVVHFAPHPDDEALAAIATLLALRDAGHTIVNVACGFGSDPDLREQRRQEVKEACRRARFALVQLDRKDLRALVDGADLVVAPADTDAHPAHAEIGGLVLDAARERPLWQWSLWSDLPQPTLYVPFGAGRLDEARHVLAAHRTQVARTDYPALLEARGTASRILGAERIFGFGTPPASPEPYAELFTERLPPAQLPAAPRILDPADLHPLAR
jgi:LmbE family N-acetylglucosaminyl deacetylase